MANQLPSQWAIPPYDASFWELQNVETQQGGFLCDDLYFFYLLEVACYSSNKPCEHLFCIDSAKQYERVVIEKRMDITDWLFKLIFKLHSEKELSV